MTFVRESLMSHTANIHTIISNSLTAMSQRLLLNLANDGVTMNENELQNYVKMSRNKSATISIDHVSEMPNYLRFISIHPDNTVWIRFRKYGFDEGGVSFRGQFVDFDEMISVLERYLDKPISEWHNFTKSGDYPAAIDVQTDDLSWQGLQDVAKSLLPKSGNFQRP